MRYDLIVLGLSAIVILFGLAIIRVGFVGQYLDQLRMVSYVKKCSYERRWYHRCITIGIGIVSILLGTSGFIVVVLSLSKQK
jgi:hypothetical protein